MPTSITYRNSVYYIVGVTVSGKVLFESHLSRYGNYRTINECSIAQWEAGTPFAN